MNTEEYNKIRGKNEQEIRKFIIDYLYNDLFCKPRFCILHYPHESINILNKELALSIELDNINDYLKMINQKLYEIKKSENTLFKQWDHHGTPLLTTTCNENGLNEILDCLFDIKRDKENKIDSSYFIPFMTIKYKNFEIIEYLDYGRKLVYKGENVFEIDIIDFLYYNYNVNANIDIYQNFLDTIDETKDEIKEFLILYTDYVIYSVFKFIKIEFDKKEDYKQEEKLVQTNTEQQELPSTEDIYNYAKMVEILKPYISGGTTPIYKSVIEKKELPKDTFPLRMNNKSNIVRFAECFKIPLAKISIIFDKKVLSKNRPNEYINDFFKALKEINPEFNPKKHKG